ncbi:MAG TPA: hypothetical protein VFC90_03470 [Planctomycetota bacterium]|nr:hypothetical protein [Planctomycetota bacterium]
MALSTCRDCNREVSTLARHCVHCGRPRPAGTAAGGVIAGVAVVVIALALTAAVVCAARKTCQKLTNRISSECRVLPRTIDCSDSFARPRAADKATFIKRVQEDDMEVTEVSPGLFELRKSKKAEPAAPVPSVEERK